MIPLKLEKVREKGARMTKCGACGGDYEVRNPHPDAGKPDRYEQVGALYVCVPCAVASRHFWCKRALKAEKEVNALKEAIIAADTKAKQ